MLFRTAAQKNDPHASWHRPDRAFFASGACHILADAFLQRFPHSAYHAVLIQPRNQARGTHLFVTDGATAFDYHGFSGHDRLISFYFRHLQRRFPGWHADLITIHEPPSSAAFCQQHNHREPHQFLHDPTPRAENFLTRLLKQPGKVTPPISLLPP
ncbi:MAG: hypothetical protein WCD79_17490 [Chthoniobacteraceae bacterium]